MGAVLLAVIALIYAGATVSFCWQRNWPWALICFGCCLVLVGNVWAIARGT